MAEINPHLGHTLEFLNPAHGRSILRTISAHVRLLPAGLETLPRLSSDGTVFVVIERRGRAMIGDVDLNLNPRDILAVPSWQKLRLAANDTLVLFGYSDKAAQEKLNLYKEKLW